MDLGVGTNYLSIDPNIAFWLQRVAKTGLAQGHYAVGKYALSMVNKIKAEMKDPALVHDRQLIDYYVAQYVRTKAELTRALKKGSLRQKKHCYPWKSIKRLLKNYTQRFLVNMLHTHGMIILLSKK